MEFYPARAPVPRGKRTGRLTLRPLRAVDVELDYQAVMSSPEMLRRWSDSDWPSDDFTLAQDLEDLERHEREHAERKAFTFMVLNPDETRCLGCVYLRPVRPEAIVLCEDAACAAEVGFWVRMHERQNGLDQHLLAALREWFEAEWAFDHVLYPISQRETHQAALFAAAGLERRLTCTLADGRPCWVFR